MRGCWCKRGVTVCQLLMSMILRRMRSDWTDGLGGSSVVSYEAHHLPLPRHVPREHLHPGHV